VQHRLHAAFILSLLLLQGCSENGLVQAPPAEAPPLDEIGPDSGSEMDAGAVDDRGTDAGVVPGDVDSGDVDSGEADPGDVDPGDVDPDEGNNEDHQEALWASLVPFIEEERVNGNIPGLAVAVTQPGEVVWTRGFGLANRETQRPVTVDTPFMLASVSKTVTAVAVMHAAQENHLSLGDEINLHLPFAVDNPRVDNEALVLRHLVTHTSGIRDNWSQMPYADGDSPHPLGLYLEGYLVDGGQWYDATENFFANMPGTVYEYGNVATALAGFVVEAATGIPFDDYCDRHIFAPLSMDNTGWHLADFDPAVVAMPYDYEDGRHSAVEHYGYPDYPDGQLRSSVADLARFLATVSNQGQLDGAVVLSPQRTEEMLSVQFPAVDATQFVFWYESVFAGRTIVGHEGSDKGVAARMVLSPESGIGVIIMLNTNWDTAGDVPETIVDALFNQAETNLAP
jgi:CubicO group peptidase (beta-lactamase class C family)